MSEKIVHLTNYRSRMGRAGYSFTRVRPGTRNRGYISAARLKRTRIPGSNESTAKRVKTFMPSRRRYASRRRRRPSRRSRKRQFVPRALTTHSKLIRVRAVEHFIHGAHTSGALVMTPIQLNSIDDPFTTTGSGQPLGYDQWKALYKKAFVVGSSITARFVNTDASYNFAVGLTPMPLSQAAVALTTYEHYMEYPSTVMQFVTPDMDKQMLRSRVSVRKHMHLNKLRDVDEIRVDLVNETAPADLCYWHLWSQPFPQDADPTGSIEFIVTAEYLVVLIDPIVPSRSVEA